MHRYRTASLVSVFVLSTLGACHKDAPAPAESAVAKGSEEPSTFAETTTQVSASTTPAKPEEPKELAQAPAAPEGEAKPAAAEPAGEVTAAKPEDKPAASTEESAADAKKSGKKKSGEKSAAGDKVADAPAKEAKPKFTELGIQVTKAGSGVAATAGKHVTIHYKASVADAEKPFDSTFTSNRPLDVELGFGAKLHVIEGLRLGLEGLTPGSEVRLQIPAKLAWGEKGNPAVGVPANADVVFEVQVLDVQ